MQHFIAPSITQSMPWAGGSVSLTDELRLRKYRYTTIDNGAPRQNFRNRLTLTVAQEITKNITWEAYYRLEISGENKNDYSPLDKFNHVYTGVTFAF
jgi:hypothetical protein